MRTYTHNTQLHTQYTATTTLSSIQNTTESRNVTKDGAKQNDPMKECNGI